MKSSNLNKTTKTTNNNSNSSSSRNSSSSSSSNNNNNNNNKTKQKTCFVSIMLTGEENKNRKPEDVNMCSIFTFLCQLASVFGIPFYAHHTYNYAHA